VRPTWRRPIRVGVAVGEAAIPVLLAAGVVGDPSSGAAARLAAGAGFGVAVVLMAGFTFAIVRAVRRGVQAPCRCFGASATPVGTRQVVRNGVVLATAAADLAGAAVALVAGVVAGALVVTFDELVDLFAA
jgi:methylamine utilization protein MauE